MMNRLVDQLYAVSFLQVVAGIGVMGWGGVHFWISSKSYRRELVS